MQGAKGMMLKLLKKESYGAIGLWFVQTTIANLEAFDQGMSTNVVGR
jgi:hypothetical protein